MSTLESAIFWSCFAVCAYAYVLYPVILTALARIFGRRMQPPARGEFCPTVTLLVAAYNEESTIEKKIQNTLELDAPAGGLQLVIASDGSSDRTVETVAHWACEREDVRLLDNRQRRGKATVLNSAIAATSGDILILSDANTLFDRQAVNNLVRWFVNPNVQTVCGQLVLADPEEGNNCDSIYWRYENHLKVQEACLGALLGANGAIYAIRRSAFVPIPDNTIIDDFVIPLLSRIRHGGLHVFDRTAIAREESPPNVSDEMARRIRIGAGGYQSLRVLWPLLSPSYGWLWFTFVSHKLLRWIVPFLFVGMLAANACLLNVTLYQVTFAAQLSFLAVAAIGVWLPGKSLLVRLLRSTAMFVGMNYALLRGFFRWLLARQQGTWNRTTR